MKNMQKALQDLTLPIDGRIKQNKRKLAFHNGIHKFAIDPAALFAEKFGRKDNVGHRDALRGFITVQDAAVYKQTAALRQDELLRPDKARDLPLFDIHKLNFRMPMPINAVKIKLPHVFPIKAEGKFRFAVLYPFQKAFVFPRLA